ncbi:uncharacterized protein RBU57_012773 [Macrochelys suwanniensis]
MLVDEAVTQKSSTPLVTRNTYTLLSLLLEMLRGKDRARPQSPDQQHALLAISYLGKFQPHLSKEQEAETISICIASTMIQRPAPAKLRGTEVAESSTIRVESLQELPWMALDLVVQMFLELHLTPTMLLHLFLDLRPMAEQGYVAGLLTSHAFSAQEATSYWASQALYWLFTPCKGKMEQKQTVATSQLSQPRPLPSEQGCRENMAPSSQP